MRRILIDMARSRRSHKRGSVTFMVSLDDTPDVAADSRRDIVAVDDALKQLAKVEPRKSQVVELRFFGGLSVEETATLLSVSPETVLVIGDWPRRGCCAR
jgi:RNA polymerase sigma factor (TIGR02999 family)